MRKFFERVKEKFLNEYLHIENEGRLREKIVFRHIAVAVVSILCCLSAMGFSAYAFFTSNVASESNKIEAAGYQAEYAVKKDAETLAQLSDMDYPTYQLQQGQYQVTIVIPSTVTASKGYCKILVGSGLTQNEEGKKVVENASDYYTCPLAPGEELTFTVQNHESAAVLQLIANWGSCSVTDEAKIVEHSDGTPEVITFGTASGGIYGVNRPGSVNNQSTQQGDIDNQSTQPEGSDNQTTTQTGGEEQQQNTSNSQEDTGNSDDVQQEEEQDTPTTENGVTEDTDNTTPSSGTTDTTE